MRAIASVTRALRSTRALGAATLLLAACTHAPSDVPAPTGPAVHALYAAPADAVRFATRGRLRPQYRAAGSAGAPLPYENAVESSLILCAALGPLFGPCAGVLLGGTAVAGVTESAINALSQPGSAAADEAELRQAFAPDPAYADVLGTRIVDAALARLGATGEVAVKAGAPAPGACASLGEPRPRAVTAVDVVHLEIELEPGFQYRLVLVVRVRSAACSDGTTTPTRRHAYRGRPVPLTRDLTAARTRFDAEVAQAVAALGDDLAAKLSGRPRP